MVAQEKRKNGGFTTPPSPKQLDKEKIMDTILTPEAARSLETKNPARGKFNVLHNTKLLLRKYRDLRWAVEQDLVNRAETESDNIDYIIGKLRDSIEIHDDPVIENRVKEIIKTKSMLTILENAVESLKTHPSNGLEKHSVIYTTYMSREPNNMMHLKKQGVFNACQMTHGQYYRRLNEAVRNLSCILWQTDGEAYALFMEIYDFLGQVTA